MASPSPPFPPSSTPSVRSSAQVSGGNIRSMLAAMGAFRRRGEQILAGRGISDVKLEGWYPLSADVGALETNEKSVGLNSLHRVGQEIPNHIPLRPGLATFEAVAGSFGPAFAMNHRGAGSGGITHEITGPGTPRIVSRTPDPCDFDRGVIRGFFSTLLELRCTIEHEPSTPCKKTGGASCTHLVRVG